MNNEASISARLDWWTGVQGVLGLWMSLLKARGPIVDYRHVRLSGAMVSV